MRACGGLSAAPVEMLPLAEVEERHIRKVLEQLEGNRQAAAEVLKIHRTTLYKKLESYEWAHW